jgi:hypothetical protein
LGLEHQPSPRGWAESSPVERRPDFIFGLKLAQSLFGLARPDKKIQKNHFRKFRIFPHVFLRHFY